ncbi:MAG: thymidine kinase [Myxococcota bacterium]
MTVAGVPVSHPVGTGWIEVITGCMFSGKTEELIRRLNRARYATPRVVVFKPAVDDRFAVEDVVSHSSLRFPSIPVDTPGQIARQVRHAVVVGIDEAQFFDDSLVGVAEHLAREGRRVIIAGLDQDYRGQPFGPMPGLMTVAEYVSKMLAVCLVCGAPANRSQRLVDHSNQVLIGASESYEARCRRHWDPHNFEPEQPSLPLAAEGDPRP